MYKKLGKIKSWNTYQSMIEIWVEKSLGEDYYELPKRGNTKYKGEDIIPFWKNFQVLGPTMKVAGTYIGSDKLGHFFHEGYTYFDKVHKYLDKEENFSVDDQEMWPSEADMSTEVGHKFESGIQGVKTTGVYSFADLEANASGYSFYLDIFRDPSKTFSIRSYMKEFGAEKVGPNAMEGKTLDSKRTSWNEERNSNFYRDDMAKIVWKNILSNKWIGIDEQQKNNLQDFELSLKSGKNDTISGKLSLLNTVSNQKQFYELNQATIEYIEGNPFKKPQENNKHTLIRGIKIEGLLDSNQKITILSRGETKLKAYLRNRKEGNSVNKIITFIKQN